MLNGERGCAPFPEPLSGWAILPPPRSGDGKRVLCFLTKPSTCSTIKTPASLRSDCCSTSARNRVRLASGMLFDFTPECCSLCLRNAVRLRRNRQSIADPGAGRRGIEPRLPASESPQIARVATNRRQNHPATDPFSSFACAFPQVQGRDSQGKKIKVPLLLN